MSSGKNTAGRPGSPLRRLAWGATLVAFGFVLARAIDALEAPAGIPRNPSRDSEFSSGSDCSTVETAAERKRRGPPATSAEQAPQPDSTASDAQTFGEEFVLDDVDAELRRELNSTTRGSEEYFAVCVRIGVNLYGCGRARASDAWYERVRLQSSATSASRVRATYFLAVNRAARADCRGAIELYEDVEADPTAHLGLRDSARYELGGLYEKAGNPARSRDWYEAFLANHRVPIGELRLPDRRVETALAKTSDQDTRLGIFDLIPLR